MISFLYGGITNLVFVSLIWIISLIKRDASIMDIFWGLGFIVVSFLYFTISDNRTPIQVIFLILVLHWGLRLAIHIALRNVGQSEDPRYAKWRLEAGKNWWWKSYFKVFLLQGIILWVVSLPLWAGLTLPPLDTLTAFKIAGVVIWSFGFLFETIADRQLKRFKKKPENRGQILNRGLWAYSRHPNYFGEALVWWGFFLMALNTGAWWTVISPILMTFLLLKVSGVAMLDKSMKQGHPEYEEYIRTTSAFIPLPKKS
jgi:steroid 5-alpha reductase family enzyme